MKILVVGHSDWIKMSMNGQTVKTRLLVESLRKYYGDSAVSDIDLALWKGNPVKTLFRIMRQSAKSDAVITLPAHNGLQVLIPILAVLSRVFKFKVFYDVIGGWLPEMCAKKKWLVRFLKKMTSIWVETSVMKMRLAEIGLVNAEVLLNFRNKTPNPDIVPVGNTVKLCFFSRVIEQKGIEDAVNVVQELISQGHDLIFDIYGPIEDDYKQKLLGLITSDRVSYKGLVDSDKSVDCIGKYDIQLFPTRFFTEGIPGSIIDSYFAGVPVLSSRWESFHDVVDDGVTGIGFEFGNTDDMRDALVRMITQCDIMAMKQSCIQKSKAYSMESALQVVDNSLNK